MQRLMAVIFVLLMSFAVLVQVADAARFGGGRSFGASRPASSSFYRSSRAQPLHSAPNQQRSLLSRIAGPALGLMAGAALASLFMGHGLGAGILSWIALAAIVMLIVSVIKNLRRPQPANQFQQYTSPTNHENRDTSHYFSAAAPVTNLTPDEPQPVDNANLQREAKALFIRLQTAYDAKNLADIRQFSSPEVYAEIQLQIQERGNAANITEVVSLHADIIEANNEGASIQFSGLIKESENEAPKQFKEIWYLDRDHVNSKWLVAGIQQN